MADKTITTEFSREIYERMIRNNWGEDRAIFYLSEMLAGEYTIQDARDDVKSFEKDSA